MSAVRRLLGWFCPAGMGELGTKQLVPQLPGLVVIWVANKPLSQLRSSWMLQKIAWLASGNEPAKLRGRSGLAWLLQPTAKAAQGFVSDGPHPRCFIPGFITQPGRWDGEKQLPR